ncbi:diaminopimelate epimerase [mine drainage metagenome]|uniref:diaminopimelate epimerase n=1 Tax=mine drainage metagenome TaxID=410659 RepID=A0A1J5QXT1_9ZZZZ
MLAMKLRFSKMQGLGNDFVVIDAIRQSVSLTPGQIRFLADRHFGIGCDQLLLVEKPAATDADFRYRIFNADGSEVEQCGNGARCFVRFVHEQGLTDKAEIRVETARGIILPRLEHDGRVTVNMGAPRFGPDDIPFIAEPAAQYALQFGAGEVTISALSMGNPHAVQIVADIETAPVAEQGPLIERHQCFPQRVNAGFMQILDPHHIKLRVFERGAGETLACGTGACAAAVAGIRLGKLASPVNVSMRGGALMISWAGDDQPVMMSGPAVTVFEGEISLENHL